MSRPCSFGRARLTLTHWPLRFQLRDLKEELRAPTCGGAQTTRPPPHMNVSRSIYLDKYISGHKIKIHIFTQVICHSIFWDVNFRNLTLFFQIHFSLKRILCCVVRLLCPLIFVPERQKESFVHKINSLCCRFFVLANKRMFFWSRKLNFSYCLVFEDQDLHLFFCFIIFFLSLFSFLLKDKPRLIWPRFSSGFYDVMTPLRPVNQAVWRVEERRNVSVSIFVASLIVSFFFLVSFCSSTLFFFFFFFLHVLGGK